VAYARKGDHRTAIDNFTKAIQHEDYEYADAYYDRALSRRAIGDSSGYQADMRQAKRIEPNIHLIR
jgi:Tfp pilus assembly protein PilF